ncbi:hypothetical protein [Candidatus Palauibacter sp.]|uniref:hypothetical protein n=1 Tax=Candidatus Palauibacter sp. TaxID=3101350 RepID=UPI003B51A9C0
MNWTGCRAALSALAVGLAVLSATKSAIGQELPPAMQLDRYTLQADRHIRSEDSAEALVALDRILALQAKHGVEVPGDFWFKHAQAALRPGAPGDAIASVLRYLELAGQEGEHYLPALELLDAAEAWLAYNDRAGEVFSDCSACPRMGVVPVGVVHDGLSRVGGRPVR